jgi:RNA polymerase sigma-70 factor (ECF subfamily)
MAAGRVRSVARTVSFSPAVRTRDYEAEETWVATEDAKRFERLIQPHLDALFRAAFRLARNTADAEDLVQDTCLRAYQGVTGVDESQPVKAWLRAILHNVFVDGARRARRSPVVGATDDTELTARACAAPNPEERASMTQREEQLYHAWLRLDCGHRALLALRAEGYSLPEIAAIAGLRIDALQSRLYRARLNLARYLKEEQAGELGMPKEMSK